MLFNEELETLETDLLVTNSEPDGDQAEEEEVDSEDEMDGEEDAELADDDADVDSEEAATDEPAA